MFDDVWSPNIYRLDRPLTNETSLKFLAREFHQKPAPAEMVVYVKVAGLERKQTLPPRGGGGGP